MSRRILSRAPIKDTEGSNVSAIILVNLTHNDVTPWVTWVETKSGDTFWGEYYRDYRTAEAGFKARCKKYDATINIIQGA